MTGESLRKLATEVRREAEHQAETKRVKCAQIVEAASGLEILRRKLGVGR